MKSRPKRFTPQTKYYVLFCINLYNSVLSSWNDYLIPMMPPAFEYFAPTGIDEVIDLLTKYGGEAKILAGGQSIIPLLKSRISQIPYLVSLSNITDLSYITEGNEGVRIGAMTIDSDIENSTAISKHFPILHDAMEKIADPLVRNVGTVGGNLSHADPANDLPAVMLALGGTMKIMGPKGPREVDVDEFFLDTFTTALEPNEVLTELRIPFWKGKSGGAYEKFKKSTWNFSVAGVAVQLKLEGGKCTEARVATTSVNPSARRSTEAEQALKGKEITPDLIKAAADAVADNSEPGDDSYGSVEYKREILRKLSREAITKAHERAEVA